MNATTTQPMPAPPVNPGPRVRCLIAIADTSLSAFEKLRLSEEAIASRPPRANLPYVRALVKYLGQIAVRGIAFGISLTRESVLARFGRHGFYLRHTITGGRVGSVRRLL